MKGRIAVTDETVQMILDAPKCLMPETTKTTKKESTNGIQIEEATRLECEGFDCIMMTRASLSRPENFSVILIVKGPDRIPHIVLRLNGNHGTHVNRLEKNTVTGPHIHRLTERYQSRSSHEDGYAEPTTSYNDLKGAVEVFKKMVNIIN